VLLSVLATQTNQWLLGVIRTDTP